MGITKGITKEVTGEVTLRCGMENMDFEEVTRMLSQASWSLGIGIDEVRRGAAHSALVVGAFCDGAQVGYARAVSDCVRFAYLSDVYVDEAYRHRGIAKKMTEYMLNHEVLGDVYRWLLKSAADELYLKVGFQPVANPEQWMELHKPEPERGGRNE